MAVTPPTSQEDLCYASAVDLRELIRNRAVSPVEVLDAFLARIEAVNPKLNAYITMMPDQARAAAEAAERAVASGEDTGLLTGIPFSIKDLSWTEGVRSTSGSQVFEDFVAPEDDPVVALMRNAGGVPLGKTNTPEFGWLAITDNEVFGRTNNPWNTDYTPSGSSGGAGAAAAAGLAAISLGSDGGGSIRHPAAFCGIYGIKPTFGLVPRSAEMPGWQSLSHQGPLTRTVADAALALDVLVAYDGRDFASVNAAPQEYLAHLRRDLKGLRVAYSADIGGAEVSPEARKTFDASLPVFEALGCELTEATPDLSDTREIFKWIMFVELVGNDWKYIEQDGTSKMSGPLTTFVTKRKDILARDYMEAWKKRRSLIRRVHEFFDSFDLLLTPTMAIPPFRHPEDMSEYPHEVNGVEVGTNGWHPFTFPFNLTGQPAASVPCGFTDDGLPMGLQIVGRRFEDLLVLQASAAFEEARPWANKRPPV